jgi:D-sedoheptulose 7-phosphate isomerase
MEKVVFTNGCFDILHPGHIDLLARARELGTRLVVGINSDASVRAIKGPSRPVNDQESRREVLLGLRSVDQVLIFDEPTPENLIKQVRPDVLVKGGDWKPGEIIGADFVQAQGGQVYSLPLKEGYSTSKIVASMSCDTQNAAEVENSVVDSALDEHRLVFESLRGDLVVNIERCADLIHRTFETGNKVLICGNGGSAADAQHMAAEFVGRYEKDRRGLPAVAVTTDTSALTALSNDFDFENVFSRQVDALAAAGDLLIAISTSGNSPNVIKAVMTARGRGCKVLGMTGAGGKKLASLCDACILVPSDRTSRIQEAHITIAHIWCEIIDMRFTGAHA